MQNLYTVVPDRIALLRWALGYVRYHPKEVESNQGLGHPRGRGQVQVRQVKNVARKIEHKSPMDLDSAWPLEDQTAKIK